MQKMGDKMKFGKFIVVKERIGGDGVMDYFAYKIMGSNKLMVWAVAYDELTANYICDTFNKCHPIKYYNQKRNKSH
jgi:hypothetical protein